LAAILKGIKRSQAESNLPTHPRLPITPEILTAIAAHLPKDGEGLMLWAACLTGFFGFLRTAEFTVPSVEQYDSGAHLSLSDVSVDNHAMPSIFKIRIKQSKTDPFRQGVDIYLGKTSAEICPVSALSSYLQERGPYPGPLFIHQDRTPLSRSQLVGMLKLCLQKAGYDDSLYNGHSFRIGAATTAAAKGLEDSLIQTLGRWRSSAYLRYVKIPRDNLAAISKTLAS
jgi:hypothetical protein